MYTKKINKKSLLTAVALVLVCVMSVMGTMAYLTKTTNVVTNTFAAASLIDEKGEFTLVEHEAIMNEDGTYTLEENSEVFENSYTVYPGVDLPKDPFVRIQSFTGEEAYLFIEVVDNTGDYLTATVDAENWIATNLTGNNGGVVYVYTVKNEVAKVIADIASINILADKTVEVADDAELTGNEKIEFYGYLLQATGFASAEEAWYAVYSSTTTD